MFGDVNLLLIFPHADVLPISIKTPQHFSFLFPFPLCTLFIVKMKLWFRFICRLTHQIPIWFLVSPLSYSQAFIFFFWAAFLYFLSWPYVSFKISLFSFLSSVHYRPYWRPCWQKKKKMTIFFHSVEIAFGKATKLYGSLYIKKENIKKKKNRLKRYSKLTCQEK